MAFWFDWSDVIDSSYYLGSYYPSITMTDVRFLPSKAAARWSMVSWSHCSTARNVRVHLICENQSCDPDNNNFHRARGRSLFPALADTRYNAFGGCSFIALFARLSHPFMVGFCTRSWLLPHVVRGDTHFGPFTAVETCGSRAHSVCRW